MQKPPPLLQLPGPNRILKLAAALRRLWRWRDDHYDVVENGVMVGRILRSPSAPKHRPSMWTSNEHEGRPPAFGYEPTREAAMASFAKSWRSRSEKRLHAKIDNL